MGVVNKKSNEVEILMHDKTLPSIIIPAYNERKVIGRLLHSLYSGVYSKRFQIVVSCNGCTDNTYDYVKTEFPLIDVINIKRGSKTNAINHAESIVTGYPRLFIDADVIISVDHVMKLIKQASSTHLPLLLAPRARIDLKNSSIIVNYYYRTWQKTKFFIIQGFGSGIYVMNRSARSKFKYFPDIIADDGFVREFFSEDQLKVVEDANSIVKAPLNIKDLIKIKSRSKLGNYQLSRLHNKTHIQKSNKTKTFLRRTTILEKCNYYCINFVSMIFAKIKESHISSYKWDTDKSSRY